MKTSRFFVVLLSTVLLAGFAACDRNPAENPTVDPVNPEEKDCFDRMMLLEQFTSEKCVNCPVGVVQIDSFVENHKNVIWLAHHAGFSDDPWTVKDSKAIVNLLGVTGAPQVALDRNYLKATDKDVPYSGYNLHPYYLALLDELPSAQTSASIRIKTDCKDGNVQIHVAGRIKEDAPDVMRLTVVIKESGLHGKQEDQFFTLAGSWTDYVHSDVVRTFVSSVGGDTIAPVRDTVEGGLDTYAMDYTVELNSNWVAENCMVVAFLTDSKCLNVVQAAEKPVVAGTKGGADQPHGGVTPKAVPEGYPEGKYSPAEFLKEDTIVLHNVNFTPTLLPNGMREWRILAWTKEQSYKGEYVPFVSLLFFTDAATNGIPEEGEFPFTITRSTDEIQPGTAWAGYCDLEAQQIVGSELMLVSKSALDAGQIIPGSNARWLVQGGKLTFRPDGFDVVATSAKNYPIRMKFSSESY